MCWLVTCPAGKDIPTNYVTTAQSINKDGYGVAWFDNQVHTFKTMDFTEFTTKLATLTAFSKVVHLRYTSVGKTNLENSHPFLVGNGAYLFHNGTISSTRTVACTTSCTDNSDTRNLADVIKLCKWETISDVLPLIHQIVGTTGNKLVFMEANGKVTVVNKNLGIEEDGIWYSNEYHIEKPIPVYQNTSHYYSTFNQSKGLTKVFVYGTLKKGYRNHSILGTSRFVGAAQTLQPFAMIGKNSAYPYLLQIMPLAEGGLHIKGEVFEVTKATMAKLDALEGYPTHYTKQQVVVKIGETYHSCVTYIKAKVTAFDLASEYISEFTSTTYTPPKEDKLTILEPEELYLLTDSELRDYLSDLEEAVYGESYTTYKRYFKSKDELLDEIENVLFFIDS